MSKRMTRVLSLILTLVMFVSVSTPAFAWGGGDLGKGWDRDIGEDEIRDFVPEEEIVEEDEPLDYFQTDGADGRQVTVEAPMGALPTLAELRAELVEVEDVREAVESVVEGEANILLAMDISFWMNGIEIEPEEPVRVKISAPELQNKTNLTLVHIPNAAIAETVDLIDEDELSFALGTNEIAFVADSFSIYAVVDDGGTGENARATYHFFKYDNNQQLVEIDTQYIREGSELVDPGVPAMSEDQAFLGWSFNADLSGDSLTIEDIRNDFDTNHTPVKEGDSVNVYAKIVNVRYLTYVDEKGVVLKTEMVTVPTSEECKTQVALAYTPYQANEYFEGWKIQGDDSGTFYKNGAMIEIADQNGVTLEPMLSEGFWLLFDENDADVEYHGTTQSSGAEYTAPVFYKTGVKTAAPVVPKRTGFTFLGWFTEPEGGTQFQFGSVLTEETKIYAHWQINTQSTYTVVVWMQNVNDSKNTTDNSAKTYDYYTSRELAGNIAETITVPTSNQYGTGISREGFHYSWNDNSADKKVNADGSTVLNIYYDRNLITFRFYKNGNSTYGPGYDSIHNQTGNNITVMTGLYGQKLSDNDYSWPAGTSTAAYRWNFYTTRNNAEGMSYLGQFVYPVGYGLTSTNEVCFYYVGNASYYVEFYLQDVNGNYANGNGNPGSSSNGYDDLGSSNGGTFSFANKYNGFEVIQYRARSGGSWGSWSNVRAGQSRQVNSSIQIRFERKSFALTYMDGSKALKSESARYEAPLAQYASYEPENVPEGYYFDGWYTDSSLTEKFDFSTATMPLDGVSVYAKWTMKRYRVVLDLGAEALADIENVSFPGGEGTTQAATFRVDYDEVIQASAIENAQWKDHTLIGWYTDPTFTTPFNFKAGVNDSVADMSYWTAPAAQRRGTDPINGKAYDDADGSHDNVVGKVTVYAKWREVVEGADGIHVKYVNNDGTTVISYDPEVYYADKAEAVAQAAPTGDLVPEDQQFLYWVQLDKDGNEVDSETYFPGQTFHVMLKYAEQIDTGRTDEAGNKLYDYIVTLKAVYGAVEQAESTKIIYNANGGQTTMTSSEEDNLVVSDDKTTVTIDPLQLNKEVTLPGTADFVRFGYRLVGWSNHAGEDNTKIFDPSQKVAADTDQEDLTKLKYTNDNTLYAVWEYVGVFYVFHSSDATVDMVDMTTLPEDGKYNLTDKVKGDNQYLYGGYYKQYLNLGEENEAVIAAAKAGSPVDVATYDGSSSKSGDVAFWASANAFTTTVDETLGGGRGTAMTPKDGQVYYLKEVPANLYLQPYYRYTYHIPTTGETNNGQFGNAWTFLVVDDTYYKEAGFIIVDTSMTAKICKTVTIRTAEGSKELQVTHDLVAPGSSDGSRLGYYEVFNYEKGGVENQIMKDGDQVFQYWKTKDGVFVTGIVGRTYTGIGSYYDIGCTPVNIGCLVGDTIAAVIDQLPKENP